MLLFIHCSLIYRVSRDFRSVLQGLIPEVILNENCLMNKGLILTIYRNVFPVVVPVGMYRHM